MPSHPCSKTMTIMTFMFTIIFALARIIILVIIMMVIMITSLGPGGAASTGPS